jgi:colanic acid/amylovoran biosynthesis glycosyltransferase
MVFTTNPSIIFFNARLLPSSETFIRAQGEELQQYNPYYVGARQVQGLSLPPDQTLVVNQGGLIGYVEEGLFKLYGFAPKFYGELQKLHPVLIHAHFGVCGALALPLMRLLKVPMIVTFYGLDATMTDSYALQSSLSTRVYLKRREALKRETDLFIGVSEFIKQKLIAQGFPEEKVIAHYYGVDIKQFQSNTALPRKPIVLFVGRFSEKKGCEYLIRAMAEVQKVMDEVELVLIGDGELRTELEELAAKLLHRYQFLGFQTQSVVQDWMNQAMLLVVPSITASNGDSEGLPTVVVEAQAMGLPVVASNHAGIPQAVIHGETGFLTNERDIEGLAENCLWLLKDPELWHRFSLKGKEHVENNFDLAMQTRTLESIYEMVLHQKVVKVKP